jgi:hypothetical protein
LIAPCRGAQELMMINMVFLRRTRMPGVRHFSEPEMAFQTLKNLESCAPRFFAPASTSAGSN